MDDVAVGEAVLEYTLDSSDSRSVTLPITLIGAGTPEARGRCEFDLTGKGRVGETIHFRLRVSDTRRIEDSGLKPQEVFYPETGWATIKLDPVAPQFEEQEIAGRRDAVREGLTAAQQEVKQAVEDVEIVQTESEGKSTLPADHTIRLNRSREGAKKAAGLLHDAAREAALNPVLRPLAAAIRDAAGRFQKDTDEAIRRAATASADDRGINLATALRLLTDASDRIEELVARNDRIARDRLDNRALAAIAAEQTALVEQADMLPPAELAKRQQELFTRLHKLLAESEPLRIVAEAARQQEVEKLAASASDLAGMVHNANVAAKQLQADVRAELLALITAEQKALATKAAALLAKIETAARLANVVPPKPEAFQTIAGLVGEGKSIPALTEMARQAASLDAVAATFEKWATDRADTKIATRHLILWQDDLRNRFRTATAGNAANFATLPAATKAAFRTEQTAIRSAVAELPLPPSEKAKEKRETALVHLTATDAFLNGDGGKADTTMKLAIDELNRLADALPTIRERLALTRGEVDKLLRDQAPILNAIDGAIRNAPDAAALAKRLSPIMEQQKKQAVVFSLLDLPGMEARRARVQAALAAAITDLKDASPQDLLASQQWVKREFERLKNILSDGTIPPDDKADELSHRLQGVTKTLEKLATAHPEAPSCNWAFFNRAAESLSPPPNPKEFDVSAATLQDIARQINQFPASPEIAALLNDARDAVQSADMAFRNGSKPQELLRRVKVATAAVGKLSDRLNGAESELDRIRRLADYRRAGAAAADKLRDDRKGPNPTVAAEIARQLGREIDEFTNTRAGAAGQVIKKRLLNQYAGLKDNATPELMAGVHAALAVGLDELAAVMADIDDLTATFDRMAPAPPPSESDVFLPSRALADELRDLARRYRAARDPLVTVPEQLVRRTKPTDAKPLAALEKKQRELAADAAKFADALATLPILPADPAQAAADVLLVADRLHDGALRGAKETGEFAVAAFRALATSDKAEGAAEFAARQEAILKELAALTAAPGVAAAQQKARGAELVRQSAELIRVLEAAARDAGPDEATVKTLTDAANTAKAAGKLLVEAAEKADAGKAEDAAALRDDAAAQLRAAGAKAAGAGPATTTVPAFNPDTVAIGGALRAIETAMRQAIRDLADKPDVMSAGKAMRTAAESLNKAAKAIGDRLGMEGK